MGASKRKQTFRAVASASGGSTTLKQTSRNLNKDQLGGVIFGCTNSTIQECLLKQIFGLPAQHFSYVQNIDPGLPLFLFNYSSRVLHGIFEAASPGQMNVNPYGWTVNGSERTAYPAQVQVHIRMDCHPLSENQFAPVIKDNYYTPTHFLFELDYTQVSKLISLFSARVVPVAPSASVIKNDGSWKMVTKHPSKLEIKENDEVITPSAANSAISNHTNGQLSLTNPSSSFDGILCPGDADTEVKEEDIGEGVNEKLQKLSPQCELSDLSRETKDSSAVDQPQDSENVNMKCTKGKELQLTETARVENIQEAPLSPSALASIIPQLMKEVHDLKTFKKEHMEKISQLEQKLIKSESEVQQLRDRCTMLEYMSNQEVSTYCAMMEPSCDLHLDSDGIILLVGGYDGDSWLSSLDSYSPSKDIMKSLRPMSSVRSYASVAKLNDDLYVIGGRAGSLWYDTVEAYNTFKDEWRSLPCLSTKKGSLAAAALHEKIFAIGGGNGLNSFSDVEMFDLNIERWISARSMFEKRFALAAGELRGSIYAVGGYDGERYLRSVERFDPREHSWSRIASMNTSRGSHSLVVLKEKLYAIGGYDGSKTVASVEVFDPRRGTWMTEAPMNHARGYSVATVLNNSVYAIGGLDDNKILSTVERCEEGRGWQLTNLKAIGKRCYASAIAG